MTARTDSPGRIATPPELSRGVDRLPPVGLTISADVLRTNAAFLTPQPSEIGATLRRLRHIRGLSLREVSRRASVDPGYLSRLENGYAESPSEQVLRQLSDALEVQIGDLLEQTGELPPDVLSAISASPAIRLLLRLIAEYRVRDTEILDLCRFLIYSRRDEAT